MYLRIRILAWISKPSTMQSKGMVGTRWISGALIEINAGCHKQTYHALDCRANEAGRCAGDFIMR